MPPHTAHPTRAATARLLFAVLCLLPAIVPTAVHAVPVTCAGGSVPSATTIDASSSITGCSVGGALTIATSAHSAPMSVVVTGSTITGIFSVIGVAGTNYGRPPLALLMGANTFTNTVLRFDGVLPPRSNVTIVGNTFQTNVNVGGIGMPDGVPRPICLFSTATFTIVESTMRIDRNAFSADDVTVSSDSFAAYVSVFVRDGSFFSHSHNTAYSRTRMNADGGYRVAVQGNNHSLIYVDGNNITTRSSYTWHTIGVYGILGNRTQLYHRFNRITAIVDVVVEPTRGAVGNTLVATMSEGSLAVYEGSTYTMSLIGSGNCYSVGIILQATLTGGSVLKILRNDISAVAWSTSSSVIAIGGYPPCVSSAASKILVSDGSRVEISGNQLRTNQDDPFIDISTMTINAGSSVVVRDNTADRHVGSPGTDLAAKNALLRSASLTRHPLGRLIVCRNTWYGTFVGGQTNATVVPAIAQVWPGCDTRTYSPPVSATHTTSSSISPDTVTASKPTSVNTKTTSQLLSRTHSEEETLSKTPHRTASTTASNTFKGTPTRTWKRSPTLSAVISTTPPQAHTPTHAPSPTTATSGSIPPTPTAAAARTPTIYTLTAPPPHTGTHAPTASPPATRTVPAVRTNFTRLASVTAPHTRSAALSASHSGLVTPPTPHTATIIPPLICADQLATASLALNGAQSESVSIAFPLMAADAAHLSLGATPTTISFSERQPDTPLNLSLSALCTAASTGVRCTVTGPLPAALDTPAVLAAAIPFGSGFGQSPSGAPCVLSLQLAVWPAGTGGASTAVVVALAVAVAPSMVAVVNDPLAVEGQAATMLLLGPCASPAERDAARYARYLLSPVAGAGPAAVVYAHVFVSLAACVAHVAVVAAQMRKAGAGFTFDAFLLAWPAARFPAVSGLVAALLYPGAAWGTAGAIAAGNDEAFAAVLGAAFLVAVPALTALVLLRWWAASPFVPAAASERRSLWSRWLLPHGRWAAADHRALAGLRGFAGPRGRALGIAGHVLLVAVCALAVVPPRAASCRARLGVLAAALITAGAVLVTLARPYRIHASNALTSVCLVLLGALAAVQAARPASVGPATAAVALLMAACFMRTLHMGVVCFAESREATALDGSEDLNAAEMRLAPLDG